MNLQAIEHINLASLADTTISLTTAFILGSLIGVERQYRQRTAGLRTNVLVAVGAAIFVDMANRLNGHQGAIGVVAYVVSGIGFLGAGAILARGEIVRGLTTAASIWTVAAIGLAVGGGLYFAAGVSTAIILVILAGVKPLEEAYRDRNQTCRLRIESQRGALTPELLKETLAIRNGQIKRFLAKARDTEIDDLIVILTKVSSKDIALLVPKIRAMSGVTDVSIVSRGSGEIRDAAT